MKKIIISIFLLLYVFSVKSQIFVHSGSDESITITPRGLQSKFTNSVSRQNTGLGTGTFKNIAIGVVGNTGMGDGALEDLTTGERNTAFGSFALQSNTIGQNNTAFGNNAMRTNIGGTENMGIGNYSLYYHDAANYIVLAGQEKLTQNMAIGFQALYQTNPTTLIIPNGPTGNGVRNLGIGYKALFANQRGEENTVLGYQAGYLNINGNRNVFIGYQAGYNHDADDILVIENSNGNRALIRGDFANDKVGINRIKADLDATSFTFQVNGDASKNTAGNWSSHSDRRLKKNISYLNSQEVLQKVLNLKGVTYEWNDMKTGSKRPEGIQFGFIAQEIREVYPSKIQEDKNGYLMTAYGDYDPMFVESIKALKELIDEQRKEIDFLKKKIQNISAQNIEKVSDK